MQGIEGSGDASTKRFAIVAGRWHHTITERLIEGALETLLRQGATEDQISLIRVPGTFEIPLAALAVARTGNFHAIITLGVVIEGDTDHYRLIIDELAAGLSKIQFETGVPVSFGVLTVSDREHAEERAGGKHGNKGHEAALAAIEMANLLPQLRRVGTPIGIRS